MFHEFEKISRLGTSTDCASRALRHGSGSARESEHCHQDKDSNADSSSEQGLQVPLLNVVPSAEVTLGVISCLCFCTTSTSIIQVPGAQQVLVHRYGSKTCMIQYDISKFGVGLPEYCSDVYTDCTTRGTMYSRI
jgi:hypothetical protein